MKAEYNKRYKVLFCDLDGTLIETISGATFPEGVWDMKLKFDVFDAIKNLDPEEIFIVSNQGGIKKGYIKEDVFWTKLHYIQMCLSLYCGGKFVNLEYCISTDKNDPRRKPNTGMLEHGLNLYGKDNWKKENMLMIGDASGLEGQFSDSD